MKLSWISLTCCLLLMAAGWPAPLAAQSCNDAMHATAPEASFTVHDDGTARDNTTSLMWMRCSLGQVWKGGNCTGNSTSIPWGAALQAARKENFAGYQDWRLPNKNELASIVEERCTAPAINARVFPSTTSGFFWTSSPYAGLANAAWSLDFGYGLVNASVKEGQIHVRLVRDDP